MRVICEAAMLARMVDLLGGLRTPLEHVPSSKELLLEASGNRLLVVVAGELRSGAVTLAAEVKVPGKVILSPERVKGFLARCKGQVELSDVDHRNMPRAGVLVLRSEGAELILETGSPFQYKAPTAASGRSLELTPAQASQLSSLLNGLSDKAYYYVLLLPQSGEKTLALATDRYVLSHTTMDFKTDDSWRIPGDLLTIWDRLARVVDLPDTPCLKLWLTPQRVDLKWAQGYVGVQLPRAWPGIPYERYLDVPRQQSLQVSTKLLAGELAALQALALGAEALDTNVNLSSDGAALQLRVRLPSAGSSTVTLPMTGSLSRSVPVCLANLSRIVNGYKPSRGDPSLTLTLAHPCLVVSNGQRETCLTIETERAHGGD